MYAPSFHALFSSYHFIRLPMKDNLIAIPVACI